MVVGAVGSVAGQVLRQGLTRLLPKYVKEFGKFDVRFHRGIFGKAGGRGFRHGRDAGLAIGSTIGSQGSGLDPAPYQPRDSPSKFPQARGGRSYKRSGRRRSQCYPRDKRSYKSRSYR